MTPRTFPAGPLLFAGILLGLAADALFRAPGPPGLNLAVWALLLGCSAWVLVRRTGAFLPLEAKLLLGTAMILALTIAWRDSGALKLLALGGTALAFALPAYRAGGSWVARANVFQYVAAVAAAVASSAFGGLFFAFDRDVDAESTRVSDGRWRRRLGPLLRGALLALPVLLVVGALFAEADAVFAAFAARVFQIDAERVFEHVVLTGFFAWIGLGYLRGFLGRSPFVEAARILTWRPSVGATETATALGLLDALFLLFVGVQLRTYFGGAAVVELTPGLSYAEYARQGFFELVAVSAIVVPFLLAADHLTRRESRREELVFRALSGVQVLLLAAVMASAAQRLRLYLLEFGLTEARLFAAAFLAWLAILLVWFAWTILRGRRGPFALGALLTGFGWIAAMILMNPDALIVRTNVARIGDGVTFDAAYVSQLSADAVPELLSALPALPPEGRCQVARALLRRWDTSPATSDWRAWSLSASRARTLVALERTSLRNGVEPPDLCPEDPT